MSDVEFSESMTKVVRKMDSYVRQNGHPQATAEHLAYFLMEDKDVRKFLEYVILLEDSSTKDPKAAAAKRAASIQRDLEDYLAKYDDMVEADSSYYNQASPSSAIVTNIIGHAAHNVLDEGFHELTGMDILEQFYAAKAIYMHNLEYRVSLDTMEGLNGLYDGDVFEYTEKEFNPKRNDPTGEFQQVWTASAQPAESKPAKEKLTQKAKKPEPNALAAFAVNLNSKAEAGEIDDVVDREDEIERTGEILGRRKKNNPILLGEAGVGKTAIVEGLAKRIVAGDVPDHLKDKKIYALDMTAVVAGTRYRGDFEERMKNIVKEAEADPDIVLFIDEMHTVMGAGATSGGAMDASNILKPALASGKLSCIGATTRKEYRQIVEKDTALARRFGKVKIKEPSEESTLKILNGIKGEYEKFHGIKFAEGAMERAIELASKHMHSRFFPDKAIDIIDEAGAIFKQNESSAEGKELGTDYIERAVSKITGLGLEKVSADERAELLALADNLKGVVFDQDEAIEALASSVKVARAGLKDPEKPMGAYLFAGPTGVGKTEVAKQLAELTGVKLIRFDMSEFMEKHSVAKLIGAPPGYVGYSGGGRLTEEVEEHPHCVLLLDEIEKAHPDIFNAFLQVMDHGKLTDGQGRTVDFRNVTIIMTSNAGAADAAEVAKKNPMGFGVTDEDTKEQDKEEAQKAAINNIFTPEFRNRLDGTITFKALKPETMGMIIDKFVGKLEDLVKGHNITLEMTGEVRDWLATKGYNSDMGARPAGRVIHEHIKKQFADMILEGKFKDGGVAKLTFNKEADEEKGENPIELRAVANNNNKPKKRPVPQPA